MKITEKEFIRILSKRTKLPHYKLKLMINVFKDIVTENINEGKSVSLINFGIFSKKIHKGRLGFNPFDTKKRIEIKDRYAIKFKASSNLKKLINK